MSERTFDSSDSARSGAPLRHAQQVSFDGPIPLALEGTLPRVTVAYETYGTLDHRGGNAVLICHALSGDSHVARHDGADDPGWWDLMVGPGRAIDTDRYFVVCPNILGGCRGTTGPNSINPATGRPYGADFPTVTVADMVEVQRRLVDHLGIRTLRAVVGGSLGGHQAVTWAVRHPERVRGCIALASSPRLTSQAVAFDVVGRNAILHDSEFRGGQYYDGGSAGPSVGLALARMLAHITYLSRESMTAKFDPTRLEPRDVPTQFEKKFSVGSYLAYQGNRFVERFDANSYVTLSMAMDLFDLGATAEQLQAVFARSQCRWLVVSFTSDWLFPPEQSRELVAALLATNRRVSYCNVKTTGGHDSFLLEENLPIYGGLVQGFLDHLDPQPARNTASVSRAAPLTGGPTSIFHGQRLDYDMILELIPPGTSVLDLGCGRGELLTRLRDRGHTRLVGVEIDEAAVLAGVAQGLDVIHADLERGLASFSDGQFDVVVLSQTLQAIDDTQGILAEMLRIGRTGVVSFPNFAYHKLRRMLAEEGRSPKSAGPYHFEWYNTPNRRFPSIADVEDLCARMGITAHRRVYLDSETNVRVTDDPNRNANMAIFVLGR